MRLADFDPQVVAEYDITEEDLDRVVRYLRLLQGPDAPTLADIAIGGYYGTAVLYCGSTPMSLTFLCWPHQTGRGVCSYLMRWRLTGRDACLCV